MGSLKRFLWIAITGMVIATITANLRIPIVPGWEIPLERSGMTSDQLYGAKAAALAILGAASLFLAFAANRPTLRIDFLVSVTTVTAAFAAGWFWLLGETGGNPVPFLIALVPAIAWIATLLAIMEVLGMARRSDERKIRERGVSKLDWRMALLTVVFFAVLAGLVYLMGWLPSRVFSRGWRIEG